MPSSARLENLGVARFNRLCRVLAGAWLALIPAASFLLRPTYQDFTSYYFAGLVARSGRWELLYPARAAASPYFLVSGYAWKPGQLEFAHRGGVDAPAPFLGLPWTAAPFVPLTWLPFKSAHAVWIALLVACTWGCACLAGASFAASANRASRWSGIVTLVAAGSPLAYRCIRVANVSPIMALALAAAVFSLLRETRRNDWLGAAALAVGGALKYATVALAPIPLALRRWRMILLAAAMALLAVAGTWLLLGPAPFGEFFSSVGATLAGSTPVRANQSVWGLCLRLTGRAPLSAPIRLSLDALAALTLAALSGLTWRKLAAHRDLPPPADCFAAASGLIAWLLLFSPIFWEHYAIYLMPMWGWLTWEAVRPGPAWKKPAALVAIAFAWLPLPGMIAFQMPEPINSTLLASAGLTLALAAARLLERPACLPRPAPTV